PLAVPEPGPRPDHRADRRHAQDPVPPRIARAARHPLLRRSSLRDHPYRSGGDDGGQELPRLLRQHHLQLPDDGRSLPRGSAKWLEPPVLRRRRAASLAAAALLHSPPPRYPPAELSACAVG